MSVPQAQKDRSRNSSTPARVLHSLAASLANSPLRTSASFEWLPVLGGLLALYVPTIHRLATSYWQHDDYAHGPIILAVLVWLIWDKRQALLTTPALTAPLQGFALLMLGLLVYVVGRSLEFIVFEVGALVPILAGTLLAMRGWSGLRGFWFVLISVVYLIPLPGMYIYALTGPLKHGVSAVADQVLHAAGYPIAHSGVVLTIGQYQLLVADACAGLNSMISLSAVGLLYLYLMAHKSLLHNCLMLASLLPIAFFANVVRVVVLALITYHLGDATGQGFLHRFSGMVLFIVALGSIVTLDVVLAKSLKPRRHVR